MSMIIVTQGLPASGKSTWAKRVTEDDQEFKRVSRDDLRRMLYGSGPDSFSYRNEDLVIAARNDLVRLIIESGRSVIIDETVNTRKTADQIEALGNDVGADVVYRTFPVPKSECLRRNAERTGVERVPDDVIEAMAKNLARDFPKTWKGLMDQ